ncbi:MAG: hypothetical protein ABUS79_15200, partial [Pseudomonadota bacterium]
AQRLSPEQIVVVGGFGFDQVAGEIARQQLPVTLVENPRFRDGNLISLMAARPHVRQDFLLMNVDHVYRPAFTERIAPPVESITAFVDVDRTLGADDMKVARDERGRIRAIAKTLSTFDCGYVGMTRVPATALDHYWAAADGVLRDLGPSVHVESILARLAQTGAPPACRDVSGIGWLEVDLAEERAAAEAEIRGAPAEWP